MRSQEGEILTCTQAGGLVDRAVRDRQDEDQARVAISSPTTTVSRLVGVDSKRRHEGLELHRLCRQLSLQIRPH